MTAMHLISATFFILFRYFHRYLLEFSSLIISFHFHLVENLYFFKLKCDTKLSKSFFKKKKLQNKFKYFFSVP